MGANSAIRKVAKKLLYPVTNEATYKYIQAASKAWDIKSGAWAEPELELLEFGLRRGENSLDIGANFGLYAYYMSRIVGPHGRVYSFEPVPFTFETLKVVARLLRFTANVELVGKGCSNQNSSIKFAVPTQGSGTYAAGLSYISGRNDDRDGKETQVRWESTREVEAQVVRLDDFLPEIDDLSLVKMDIEGAEYFCLQGAKRLFDRHKPTTICEINPWYLDGFGVKVEELTDFFLDIGYKVFFYSRQGSEKKLSQVQPAEIVEDNYVFIHPDRYERFATLLPPMIA